MLLAPTPAWLRTRSRWASSRPAPPTRWAPIAAAENGVHRAQPDEATLARSSGLLTSFDAPLTATAPIREPPNQAAAPTSCRDRMIVLRLLLMKLLMVSMAQCLAGGTGAPSPRQSPRWHRKDGRPRWPRPGRRRGQA